jgi:hypothetical protein
MTKSFNNSIRDPLSLVRAIQRGINVYSNYTGELKCLDISSDTPSDLGVAAWGYQVTEIITFSNL